MKFKIGTKTLLGIVTAIMLNGCGGENESANVVGDNLVEANVIANIDSQNMLAMVQTIDPTATNAFASTAVKLQYKTTNQDGEVVNASGLLTIPTPSKAYVAYLASIGKTFSISMICDNHGTIFTDAEAPSNIGANYPLSISATGLAGFALVAPDYIGYGDTKSKKHPYLLKKASAQSSFDMIQAAQKYMAENGYLFNGQVYISGYSQGGYNALALAKKIEQNHAGDIAIKAVSAMAGPYNPKALADDLLDTSKVMVYPGFLAYIVYSYSNFYDDVDLVNLSVANPTTYDTVFDTMHSAPEIHGALGLTTNYGYASYTADALFKTSFINDYQSDTNNVVKARFEENIITAWNPKTKIQLVHCVDDEIIPFSQSQNMYDDFISNGASTDNVTLVPIPTASLSQQQDAKNPFVHANCTSKAYGATVNWFSQIRSGEIK